MLILLFPLNTLTIFSNIKLFKIRCTFSTLTIFMLCNLGFLTEGLASKNGKEADEEALVLSDEEDTPKRSHKRIRKLTDISSIAAESETSATSTSGSSNSIYKSVLERRAEFIGIAKDDFIKPIPYNSKFELKDDSDDEDDENDNAPPPIASSNLDGVNVIGTRLKLLSTVYLRNLDHTANIFFPRYTCSTTSADQSFRKSDYFRTPKGEVCVFASGGTQNVWEKTVAAVQEYFFGLPVKLIRISWIQKQLYRKGVRRNFEEEFKGREDQLHSEFYYNLFFKHFFIPYLKAKKVVLDSLNINAFSWWEVCNKCEREHLTPHQQLLARKQLLSQGAKLTYTISATRRYKHHYPLNKIIAQELRTPPSYEEEAWARIWEKVNKYANKQFDDLNQKRIFWTKTREGLEVCKWLGQAFVENTVTLDAKEVKITKRGDILKFYRAMDDTDKYGLHNLLIYLRKENWELSCWYKGSYIVDLIQLRWKKYWKQIVMPHFGWEEVDKHRDEEGESHCEICGKKNIKNLSWVFHPKFKVSDKFLKLSEAEQNENAMAQQYRSTRWEELPISIKKKREMALFVGSECVQVLTYSQKIIEDWVQKHSYEEAEAKWQGQEERLAGDDDLDRMERELKEKSKIENMRKNK